jgi:hypothetical protein
MAQTIRETHHLPAVRFDHGLLAELYTPAAMGRMYGKSARIPITLSPANRTRRDWGDAIAWLQERESARIEWPWPER